MGRDRRCPLRIPVPGADLVGMAPTYWATPDGLFGHETPGRWGSQPGKDGSLVLAMLRL